MSVERTSSESSLTFKMLYYSFKTSNTDEKIRELSDLILKTYSAEVIQNLSNEITAKRQKFTFSELLSEKAQNLGLFDDFISDVLDFKKAEQTYNNLIKFLENRQFYWVGVCLEHLPFESSYYEEAYEVAIGRCISFGNIDKARDFFKAMQKCEAKQKIAQTYPILCSSVKEKSETKSNSNSNGPAYQNLTQAIDAKHSEVKADLQANGDNYAYSILGLTDKLDVKTESNQTKIASLREKSLDDLNTLLGNSEQRLNTLRANYESALQSGNPSLIQNALSQKMDELGNQLLLKKVIEEKSNNNPPFPKEDPSNKCSIQ